MLRLTASVEVYAGHVAKIRTSLGLLAQKLCLTLIPLSNPNSNPNRNPYDNYKRIPKVSINLSRYNNVTTSNIQLRCKIKYWMFFTSLGRLEQFVIE